MLSDLYRPGAYTAITGLLGAGKTALAVLLLRSAYDDGRQVYANVDVTFARRLESWPQLLAIRDAVVLLDEVQMLFDSRGYAGQHQRLMTYWLQVVRKRGVTILYTTQAIHQVDVRLRTLTGHYIQLSALPGPVRRAALYRLDGDVAVPVAVMGVDISRAYGWYDTYDERVILAEDPRGRAYAPAQLLVNQRRN